MHGRKSHPDKMPDIRKFQSSHLFAYVRSLWAKRKAADGTVGLLERFESLGDNCEFGLVQEQLHAKTLSLLRTSGVPVDGLIAALDSNFAAFVSSERQEVWCYPLPDDKGLEHVVRTRAYEIDRHAGVHAPDTDHDRIRAIEIKKAGLLRRKLIEDLTEGEKIFVYKSMQPIDRSKVDALVAAMRRYGPTTLLWVTLSEPGRMPGTVERLGDGLLRGYLDRFAPPLDAYDSSLEVWQSLCAAAYDLWRGERRQSQAA
jgi:hypothetical protein